MPVKRIYLVDYATYEARLVDGKVVKVTWADTPMRFMVDDTRALLDAKIDVVRLVRENGKRDAWHALDKCYSERHAPAKAPRTPSDYHTPRRVVV